VAIDENANAKFLRGPINGDDPFLGEKPKFKRLHHSVQKTANILEKLEPHESKRYTGKK
jgi:hypothetical protein